MSSGYRRRCLRPGPVPAGRRRLKDHLGLPIHDEIIVYVPGQDTREVARVMATIMASDFMGVPIAATNATILGERWHK